jgi:hypothetical protein
MISMWFLHQLRALRDGGLSLSFDDVVEGIDKASANAKMDITRGEVDEETVLRCIADVCRKRVCVPLAPHWAAAMRDKTAAADQPQN